jgi:hypothetical protein
VTSDEDAGEPDWPTNPGFPEFPNMLPYCIQNPVC